MTQILRDLSQIIQKPHCIPPLQERKKDHAHDDHNMVVCQEQEGTNETAGGEHRSSSTTRGQSHSPSYAVATGNTDDTDVVMQDATQEDDTTLKERPAAAMFLPQQTRSASSIPLIPRFFNNDNRNVDANADAAVPGDTRMPARAHSIFSNPLRQIHGARYRARNYSSSSSSSSNSSTRRMYSSRWESSQDVDKTLFDTARNVTNTRPASSFVVYNSNQYHGQQQQQSSDQEGDDEPIPLYDGAVANSTPMGGGILRGGARGGGGGGSGTILHLAIALDCPLVLATLLVLGGDVMSRHTAFRRLILHEAACANSPKCLTLLLSFGNSSSNSNVKRGQNKKFTRFPPEKTMVSRDFIQKKNYRRGNNSCRKGASGRNDSPPGTHESDLKDSLSRHLSFVEVLYTILELNEKVNRNELSDMDAAFHLLSKVPLNVLTRNFLIASSRLESVSSPNQVASQEQPSLMECQVDGHGNTPLHWAAFKNSVHCLSILLSYQANPNITAQPSGWTALHDAAYSDSAESISILIEAGACVDAQAHSGATPLCFAAQEDAPNATRLLLEANADPSIRCCESIGGGGSGNSYSNHHNRFSGYTPLHYCAHYNAHHAARVLINYSMKTQERNVAISPLLEIPELSGRLPIHVAVLRGSSDVLKELLHGGAHIEKDIKESETTTPQREYNVVEDDTSSVNTTEHDDLSDASDAPMSPIPNNNSSAIVTPTSSPVLRSLIPQVPITSSKPWNCISQRSIDQCKTLLNETEQNWTPERHSIFHPRDRLAVAELLRVGKRLEQMGTGIFRELWPLVLSFCGREWFELEKLSAVQTSEQMQTDPDHLILPTPFSLQNHSTS